MDETGLRRRKLAEESSLSPTKDAVKTIAALDVFPKVPSDFKKPTNCGAALTFICAAVCILLIVMEFFHYRQANLEFSYSVDKDHSSKLPVAIDITVAMPCEAIGADIVDLVNEQVDIDVGLNEEPAYFALSPEDEHNFQMRRQMNAYIAEEYHALHRYLWTTGHRSSWADPAPRKLVLRGNTRPDACRFYGLVHVNKMAGNFHVLAGKALHGADIHAHISFFVSEAESNFSHRIDRLGFGASDYAIINPLDGELKTTKHHSVSYQYNLKVVPTEVTSRFSTIMTYQYGVQATERILNHSSGVHGIPGIFIKYDINPMQINVSDKPVPILHFLVRVCGVVGGIFATTGILSSLINSIIQRFFAGEGQKKIPFYKQDSLTEPHPSKSPAASGPPNALFALLGGSTNTY
ncbi:Endoplasmic reticulum-Golgi intermediate compartment protein 2 [Hypsibius exemplaris]|uniref:Endoplasmic reticulum-Golgi intermediate compartment protein 2 n=1 Tax=Hypsibius exemplaris TaxID=2072580 RepID=A0A1W0WZN3_HYPEX|nr:Endoplasmic reticulum-Golgi intermediate compartment protein 2 [Hypsibius exemplaris]